MTQSIEQQLEQLRIQVSNLSQRDVPAQRGLSKRQVEGMIQQSVPFAGHSGWTFAGAEPQQIATDDASTTDWVSVSLGFDEVYIRVELIADADTDKMVFQVKDGGVEFTLLEMGTADNDADNNPLIATHLVTCVNQSFEYIATITAGAPVWLIEWIKGR